MNAVLLLSWFLGKKDIPAVLLPTKDKAGGAEDKFEQIPLASSAQAAQETILARAGEVMQGSCRGQEEVTIRS